MVLPIAGRNNGRPEAARANKSFTVGTLRRARLSMDDVKKQAATPLPPPAPIILSLSRACRGVALRNFQREHSHQSRRTNACCMYIVARANKNRIGKRRIGKIVHSPGKMIGGPFTYAASFRVRHQTFWHRPGLLGQVDR